MDDAARAVEWLLDSPEPAVRLLTRRNLFDEQGLDFAEAFDGPWAHSLLANQEADGGFGVHPYSKWTGAHWRLVSLTELGVPAGDARVQAAIETVLDWLLGAAHRDGIRAIDGRTRRCASQEGNALAVACRAGMADDPRIGALAADLAEWQWPDGGWNCDKRPEVEHSSVNESLPPMWGLHEYGTATGEQWALEAANRTAEFFLEHEVYKSHTTGEVLHPNVVRLRYPPYWHYNVLHGVLILARMGRAADPRARAALELIVEKRSKDGRWHAQGKWWMPSTSKHYPEVVAWDSAGPNTMLTLHALTALAAAGEVQFIQ
jgi:hypothetical protein